MGKACQTATFLSMDAVASSHEPSEALPNATPRTWSPWCTSDASALWRFFADAGDDADRAPFACEGACFLRFQANKRVLTKCVGMDERG